ncbi:MAG: PQQ-binding-like beta-propeller repeat protein, partial [Planctomycetota bacterium]|nr:PQQ-binding-like beta-propeller repeat protein [Planctomycetota bacterium]
TIWKGKEEWGDRVTEEISLRGKGNEPGFFEAVICGDVVVTHGMYDVLAFRLEDGRLKWRYQVPFDFEIREAVESGDILVLAGKDETIALYMGTDDPRGEVIWQEKEEGDLYVAPYFHGDRLVSVRKYPFNMTVRYRATGKLIGRLALPDLTMHEEHPLLKEGPRELPFAREGGRLVVSDGWYYIMVDVERMKVAWKRLIDNNDPTKEPAMRFALGGGYFAVVKEDYDQKAIYMLSSESGEVLWNTDPKVAGSPQPVHSMVIDGGKVYGIGVHPGQGYYFVARECGSGKQIYSREQKGYDSAPEVRLLPRLYGGSLVCLVRDRQEFEVSVFTAGKGELVHRMKMKGVGNFGEHGRVSVGVHGGRIAFLSKDKLRLAAGKAAGR